MSESGFILSLGRNIDQQKNTMIPYLFAQNNPLFWVDYLGLENIRLFILTIIRPPDPQAGVKSTHLFVIDDDGKIIDRDYTVGFTSIFGFPFGGSDPQFSESIEGKKPEFKVNMRGYSASSVLPPFLDIYYCLKIDLDFCSRKGRISGRHDGYPSYTVQVTGAGEIYNWQQQTILSLIGDGEISVNKEFSF